MSDRPEHDASQSELLRFAAVRAVGEIDAMDAPSMEALVTALMCAAWPTPQAQSQ
jgi:hypothetical protein